MLFFSIGSVSSQSLNDLTDTCDIKDTKVLKSNALSGSLSSKTTTLTATTKAKASSKKTTLAATTKAKANTKTANPSKKSKTTKTTKKTTTKKTNKSKTTKKTTTKKTATTSSAAKKTTTKKTDKGKTTKKTNTTTVNRKTLAKTSASFMNSVEKNGKFPKVKISNKNYSNTEYLYLISKAVENDSNSKIEIKSHLIKSYNNTKIKSAKGTLNKTEYMQIASKTRKFIEKNQRAPNWASSSKGNIPYNQLILTFSKCLDSYNKNNKLPNSVKLDDLDLDRIKNKINKQTSKSTNSSIKKNTTKTTTKKTNTTTNTTKKTTTPKKTNTTTNTTKKTTTQNIPKNTKENKVENATNDNVSLIEKSMSYVNNILNNILDKLDPSKFQIDITQSDEAKGKFNTSKVNVDVSGKSSVNVKISAKDTKNSAKTTTTKKTATTSSAAKKTNKTNSAKKTTTNTKKTADKTNGAKKTTTNTKKTANKTVSKTANMSKALKEYLVSSKNCQVNNKQIKELATKLTSSLKSDYEKGKKLFTWVRDNVQYKRYSNTRRGALKTLQSKKGNCVDQSHLLIALSRAAGIPARYVNGGNCKFSSGYVAGHVWTQLYIKNKWIVADTTSSSNSLGKIKNWNTKSYTLYGKYSSINF